jgi:hypothetical protein
LRVTSRGLGDVYKRQYYLSVSLLPTADLAALPSWTNLNLNNAVIPLKVSLRPSPPPVLAVNPHPMQVPRLQSPPVPLSPRPFLKP